MTKKLLISLLCSLLLVSSAFGQGWNMPGQKPWLGKQIDWSHPLSKGLVGCWILNEGGGNKVYDLSGRADDGVLSGDAMLWQPGKFGSCLSFGGTDDWIDISDDRLPAFGTNDFTIVICAKHAQDNTERCLFSKGRIGAGEFQFYKASTDKVYMYGDSGSISFGIATADTWPDDIWTQWVVRRSGVVCTIWQDLSIVATDSSAGADLNTATDWRIGAAGNGGSDYAGLIDHLLIYNRALNAQEIQQLYIEPFCMFEPVFPIWWWGGIGEAPAGGGQVIFINGN